MPRPTKYAEDCWTAVCDWFECERPIAQSLAAWAFDPGALRRRVRQVQVDSGRHSDLQSNEGRKEIRKLRRENFELRCCERDLAGERVGEAVVSAGD